MARRRLPTFYLQVAGGLVATLWAVGLAATPLRADLSLVVTANIVMLLAGIGFMGAIQDALTGFYVTSGARVIEALLATAGIIAGVSAGLSVGDVIGVNLGTLGYLTEVEPQHVEQALERFVAGDHGDGLGMSSGHGLISLKIAK